MGSCQGCQQKVIPVIPSINQLSTYNQLQIQKIIRIQAFCRGILVRKRINIIKSQKPASQQLIQVEEHATDQQQYYTDRSTKTYILTNQEANEPIFQQPVAIQQQLSDNISFNQTPFWDGYVEGDFSNGLIQGHAIYKAQDGSIYDGEWKNGVMDGMGYYFNKTKGTTYKGQWRMGRQNGEGFERYSDSSVYEGSFRDGKKDGEGKFVFADGSLYIGGFQDDKFHGFGNFFWDDKSKSYSGDWQKGKKHGHGIMKVEGKYIYEGEYKNGIKDGIGHITWVDGRSYNGKWREGFQHGEGTYTDSQGFRKNGIWLYGRFQL